MWWWYLALHSKNLITRKVPASPKVAASQRSARAVCARCSEPTASTMVRLLVSSTTVLVVPMALLSSSAASWKSGSCRCRITA